MENDVLRLEMLVPGSLRLGCGSEEKAEGFQQVMQR